MPRPNNPFQYYPVFLDLRERKVLLIGGGPTAVAKLRGLLPTGARVVLIAPEAEEYIAQLATEGQLLWLRRPYKPQDLNGCSLVIVTTNSPKEYQQAAQQARQHGIPINVADNPAESDFITPAVVHRGELQLAISTGGKSPALARFLREQLERLLGEEYTLLLQAASKTRQIMQANRLKTTPQAWQMALTQGLLLLQRGVPPDQVADQLLLALKSPPSSTEKPNRTQNRTAGEL